MSGYPEEQPNGGSIAAPLLRALLAAAVVFGVYALVFGSGTDDELPVATTSTPEATVAPIEPVLPPQPLEPTETLPPIENATTEPATAPGAAGQIGAGLSIQILAAPGTSSEQVDDATAALTALGFDIAASGPAASERAETTLFASAGSESSAEALRAAEPRIAIYDENNPGLDSAIDLHVVVAPDWTVDDAAEG